MSRRTTGYLRGEIPDRRPREHDVVTWHWLLACFQLHSFIKMQPEIH